MLFPFHMCVPNLTRIDLYDESRSSINFLLLYKTCHTANSLKQSFLTIFRVSICQKCRHGVAKLPAQGLRVISKMLVQLC